MAENGLNACFGGISRTTQTFAVRSAVLSRYDIGKASVFIFYIDRIFQKFVI